MRWIISVSKRSFILSNCLTEFILIVSSSSNFRIRLLFAKKIQFTHSFSIIHSLPWDPLLGGVRTESEWEAKKHRDRERDCWGETSKLTAVYPNPVCNSWLQRAPLGITKFMITKSEYLTVFKLVFTKHKMSCTWQSKFLYCPRYCDFIQKKTPHNLTQLLSHVNCTTLTSFSLILKLTY